MQNRPGCGENPLLHPRKMRRFLFRREMITNKHGGNPTVHPSAGALPSRPERPPYNSPSASTHPNRSLVDSGSGASAGADGDSVVGSPPGTTVASGVGATGGQASARLQEFLGVAAIPGSRRYHVGDPWQTWSPSLLPGRSRIAWNLPHAPRGCRRPQRAVTRMAVINQPLANATSARTTHRAQGTASALSIVWGPTGIVAVGRIMHKSRSPYPT